MALVVAIAACHHGATPAGSGSGVVLHVKKVQLAWGLQPNAGNTTVYLQTTDETGAQVSHSIGDFPGACNVIDPGPMKALTSLMCGAGGAGTELDVVAQGETVIVLRLHVDAGVKPDPMSREELTRFDAPPGAAIEAKPL